MADTTKLGCRCKSGGASGFDYWKRKAWCEVDADECEAVWAGHAQYDGYWWDYVDTDMTDSVIAGWATEKNRLLFVIVLSWVLYLHGTVRSASALKNVIDQLPDRGLGLPAAFDTVNGSEYVSRLMVWFGATSYVVLADTFFGWVAAVAERFRCFLDTVFSAVAKTSMFRSWMAYFEEKYPKIPHALGKALATTAAFFDSFGEMGEGPSWSWYQKAKYTLFSSLVLALGS